MAGFPSRRTLRGFLNGPRRTLRRPDRRTTARYGLTAERLEQRALMAVDSFDELAPCMPPDDMWTPSADIAPAQYMSPAVEAPLMPTCGDAPQVTGPDCPLEAYTEMAPGYAPLVNPDGGTPPVRADFPDTTQTWEMMAAMSAGADTEAELQAAEEASRAAEMKREMSLFYRNLPRLDADAHVPPTDSMDLPAIAPLDDTVAPEVTASNERSPTMSPDARWTGELMSPEDPPVDRAAPANGSSAEWMPLDMARLTVSGVTPSQPTEIAIPMYTMSTVDMTVPPVPEPQLPENAVTMVSAIQGDVYDPAVVWATQQQVVESPRWTAMDRAAKLASYAAYSTNDGGLLRDFVPDYDPTGVTGRYGKVGFSATLSRASDVNPQLSEDVYILAFRGTAKSPDWSANVAQVAGFRASQFEQSIALSSDVRQSLPAGSTLITTGHSKGGAQAVAVSYAIGTRAIVFNPSSVSDVYRQGVPGSIETHITFGDPLSALRTIQNALDQMDPPSMQDLRTASGEVIVHPPRSLWTHSLDSLPR